MSERVEFAFLLLSKYDRFEIRQSLFDARETVLGCSVFAFRLLACFALLCLEVLSCDAAENSEGDDSDDCCPEAHN